jgi:hypothetical protein
MAVTVRAVDLDTEHEEVLAVLERNLTMCPTPAASTRTWSPTPLPAARNARSLTGLSGGT